MKIPARVIGIVFFSFLAFDCLSQGNILATTNVKALKEMTVEDEPIVVDDSLSIKAAEYTGTALEKSKQFKSKLAGNDDGSNPAGHVLDSLRPRAIDSVGASIIQVNSDRRQRTNLIIGEHLHIQNDSVKSLLNSKVPEPASTLSKQITQSELQDKVAEDVKPAKDLLDKLNATQADDQLDRSFPATSTPDIKIPERVATRVPEFHQPDFQNLTPINNRISNFKDDTNIGKLTNRFQAAENGVTEAQKYQTEIKQMRENGLEDAVEIPDKIENEVTELDQMKTLRDELQRASSQQREYQLMVDGYTDKKNLRREMLRKGANVVDDRIGKYKQLTDAAHEKFSKLKKIRSSAPSVKALTHKRLNEMKNKPFMERLVPGIMFKISSGQNVAIDFGPQIGFRISGRLTTGAGSIFRETVNKKINQWPKHESVPSWKVYGQWTVKKDFFSHVEFESRYSRTTIAPGFGKEDLSHHQYIINFGLGKSFNISRKIRGSVITLYGLDLHGKSSKDKINMITILQYNTSARRKRY